MSNIEDDNDVDLVDFTAAWRTALKDAERVTVSYAVIGLTNFGEHPVPSARLAEVLRHPVGEAEAMARRWGWPGTRVENGLITVDPERAQHATRRQLQIGDRRFGVTGCGPDIFQYAPLVRPSLQVEETCPATGTPIRLVFTPTRVQRVEPTGAVMVLPLLRELAPAAEAAGDIEDVDTHVCMQMPLFSSAEAAQRWLADHPGGHVFPIRQAWDLSIYRDWRDKMSALLRLDN